MKNLILILFVGIVAISCNEEKTTKEEEIDEILTEESNERSTQYSGWNNYVDSTKNYLISFPNDWEQQEHPNVNFLALHIDTNKNAYQDNFHIIIYPVKDEINIKQFAYDFLTSQEEQFPDAEMRDLEEGTINNKHDVDSYYAAYITNFDGTDVYCYNVFLRLENEICNLNFYCKLNDRKKDALLFDRILSSFTKY